MKIHILPLALLMVASILLAGISSAVGLGALSARVKEAIHWIQH